MTFQECISNAKKFGVIAFHIEAFALPFTKKLIQSIQGLPERKFILDGSENIVTGPITSDDWPDNIATEKMQMQCWRIRLQNSKSNISYEIGERAHWGLTALDVNEEGQSGAAVYLECKND